MSEQIDDKAEVAHEPRDGAPIRLTQIRYADSPDGPWSKPEAMYRGGYVGGGSISGWGKPVDSDAEHAAYQRDFRNGPGMRWETRRVVEYVPCVCGEQPARRTKRHFEAELRQLDAHASKDGSRRSWYRRRISDALVMIAKGDTESAWAQLVDALDNEPLGDGERKA